MNKSELEILAMSDVLQYLLLPHLQVHLEEVYLSQGLHLYDTVMHLPAWVPDDDGFYKLNLRKSELCKI